jgi:GMP synthase-like glutamine amidotransferase
MSVPPPAGGVSDDTARLAELGYKQELHRAAAPHPSVQEARPDRDAFELALAAVTQEWDTPVLGICRGMQVMAVAAGGKLEQHVPDRVGHDEHSPAPGIYGSHDVRTVEGTRVAAILGQQVAIPSYHHQSVSSHPGYVPAAWAQDGTLEAMEQAGSRFRVAVQWHPEAGQDPACSRPSSRPVRRLQDRGCRVDHNLRRRGQMVDERATLLPVSNSWTAVATATIIID